MRNELEKLQAELKGKNASLAVLQNRVKKLEEEHEEYSAMKKTIEKGYSRKIAQLQSQLIGSVRRINYLVEEKKNMLEDAVKRSHYISKLELEIIRSNNQIKELTSKLRLKNFPENKETIREFAKTLKANSLESLKEVEREIQEEVLLCGLTCSSKICKNNIRESSLFF